jgi:hypothetical protein
MYAVRTLGNWVRNMQVTLAADGERDRQTEKRKKMKKQRDEYEESFVPCHE